MLRTFLLVNEIMFLPSQLVICRPLLSTSQELRAEKEVRLPSLRLLIKANEIVPFHQIFPGEQVP